jgi:transcriptional regulator with XRE-family HTH domain
MGRYRLGDIVRMTRKSLSITQEQLSESICSVETLSRIENGSQNPTRDTYELLMERMGRIRSRAYSMLSVSDLKVLEKMKLFEDYIKMYDFDKAEKLLEEIKSIVGNSILDQQFVTRANGLVNYQLKRINIDDFLSEFQKAIKVTIPKYGLISLANWPLSFNEVTLLINISSAYAEKGEFNNAISILEEVYIALKQSYMEEFQRAILQVTIASNLSKIYGIITDHEKAIEIANEGVSICKKFKLGNVLPYLLYNIAWNKEKLMNMGVQSICKDECLNYLKKAYYIASAMQLSFISEIIKEHIMSEYDKVLTGFTN